MKKTLKLVGIFMAIIVVAVVGGLSGYYLITKNKTYYIYDLRIVQPVADADTYVYVNSENQYVSMKNQRVYMTAEEENFIPIAIYASTSTETKKVEINSSDPSVAKIVFKGNECFINYLKAGTAVITTSLGGVEDSITVEVFDQVAEDFSVYDYKYYGDYASYFPNQIIGYSDSITYEYDYVAYSASGETAGDLLNNELLRIDTTKLNNNVFAKAQIDSINKKLVLECKSNITSNLNEQIIIQSYTYSEDGEVKVENNYVVNVNIVAYTPEFLQVELATTPDFEDACVFMNTIVIDDADLTEENILNNPEILDEYLSYQKAENNLVEHEETSVYKTLFTDKVSKIYLKFRKVYTNGDIVYLNPLKTSTHYNLEADTDYLKLAPTKDFYVLTLSEDYFETHDSFDIELSLLVSGSEHSFNLRHTFKFEFANLIEENCDLFYSYDVVNGVYTYDYWDKRTRFDNEVYNEAGQVVSFY